MGAIRKKRKFEMGRPAALTKLGAKRIHSVRCRGGNIKYRALRLESGNFNWPTEATTAKTRILTVLYNASNNELVRTNTLVKNCIVQIDATPFRQWYKQHYGVEVGKKKVKEGETEEETKQSKSAKTDLLPATRPVSSILPLPSNSLLVVFWLAFLVDLDNAAVLMATSLRALSSSSTTRRS